LREQRKHFQRRAGLQRRVAAARQELLSAADYDFQVINDDLDEAVQAFRTILRDCGGT